MSSGTLTADPTTPTKGKAMPEVTKNATFYANRKRPTPKTFHIEVDGAIVNITVGLTDASGHLVTRVETIPDGLSHGGDGWGYMWVHPYNDYQRILRLHDWERAPGIPRDCTCDQHTDEDGDPREPDLVTCGECDRSWCDRCTGTHGPRCPFELWHADAS